MRNFTSPAGGPEGASQQTPISSSLSAHSAVL